MRALPRVIEDDVPQVTGIACPDCPGVLAVRAEGHEVSLSFFCRIGHTYPNGHRSYRTLFDERMARAREAVTVLREIVRMNRPVDLAPAEPGPLMADPPAGPASDP